MTQLCVKQDNFSLDWLLQPLINFLALRACIVIKAVNDSISTSLHRSLGYLFLFVNSSHFHIQECFAYLLCVFSMLITCKCSFTKLYLQSTVVALTNTCSPWFLYCTGKLLNKLGQQSLKIVENSRRTSGKH